jgi:GTP cyclohydrolase I
MIRPELFHNILSTITQDPNREGLKETPARMAKAYGHWFGGYDSDPGTVLKSFEDGGETYNQLVIVCDIPIYSHCEHHLAPFFGVAHIGYIPNKRIVGLSKLARVADLYARRLQVQERLTDQIAQCIQSHLQPQGVAVMLNCRHLCMESRGVQCSGTSTLTSSLKGVLMDDPAARAEFFSLVKMRSSKL